MSCSIHRIDVYYLQIYRAVLHGKRRVAMLTRDQVDSYFELGFTIVEGAVPNLMLERARTFIDRLVADASLVSRSNDVYDLEDSHTPAAPRVRRIKEPVERDPLFWELVRSPGVLEPVQQL